MSGQDPLAGLNPPQREAVRLTDVPALVLAGAGSGKTRVITMKIAWLIREQGVKARNIVALTFTNKAAREMRARVGQLLERGEARGLSVSTFHTLGLNFLKREYERLGYRRNFSLLDRRDAEQIFAELTRKANLSLAVEVALNQISSWKNAGLTPALAMAAAETDQAQACAALYAEYQNALHAYNAFDLDDLVVRPVWLLKEDPAVREHWQSRVRHLLVDEYQDTNQVQYDLVCNLVGRTTPFTAVGDDDQSIYTWRGARPDNLNELARDFPRLQVIKLEQNYRSTGVILRCANQVISNNPHLFDKRLWSALGHGELPRVLACRDPEHEAERVVSEILHQRFTHNTPAGHFAILYRGNFQSRPFEKALRECGVPYLVSGSTGFFDYAEVKDLIAYLRLAANPDDDRAFLRVVNTPRRGIGARSLEALAEVAGRLDQGLFASARSLALGETLNERACRALDEFAGFIEQLMRLAEEAGPLIALRTLIKDIDYEGWLQAGATEPRDAERRWKNVEELLAWLERMLERDPDMDTPALVQRLCLMDILDRGDDEGRDDCVRLMTLHAAKGLEFPHVFLVGMEEGLLPHRAHVEAEAEAPAGIEEERRLAYVGITRARETLTMTYAGKRKAAGEWSECQPSRFLSELPAEAIEWAREQQETDPEKRKARGRAHLAQIRALLAD